MTPLEQIQEMEKRLLKAMLASDVHELDGLISDQAIVSGADGRLSTKTDDIAAHRDGSLRILVMSDQETTIRIFSEVAVVFALMDLQGTFLQQSFAGRFRYTRVWHNQDGKWQIVAAHIGSLPDQ